MRLVIIDIGSNSIRYKECGFIDGRPVSYYKQLRTTRLGEDIAFTGMLSQWAMDRSIEAITEFISLAGSLSVYAYATSAVREALNGKQFVAEIKESCGLDVEVLSEKQEAKFAYAGATKGRKNCCVIDVGGGSTEIVSADSAVSFPIGCVRAKDLLRETPDEEKNIYFSRLLRSIIKAEPVDAKEYIGVGGTITTLAAMKLHQTEYDSNALEELPLSAEDIEKLIDKLEQMGDFRRMHPLLLDRHDVIICGAKILQYVMQSMGITTISVTDSDGMDGYMLHVLDRLKKSKEEI